MLTLEQARTLTYRTVLYHDTFRNADDTPERWRINGKVKTWKRTPGRLEVPLKRGLRQYWYLTDANLVEFSLTEKEALGQDLFDEVDRVDALLD